MKTLVAAFLLILLGGGRASAQAPAQEGTDFGMFYSSLASQGEWISVEGGTYAWHPAGVDPEWRPYTDGHWVWTDDGWYWASDEPWAWATYHYGRWYRDDYYGWVWVPGYEWAPAWVEWRYGEDCVGWAPLSPYAVFSANWGIHYRRYWATPYSYWSFVDCRYMGHNDLRSYVYRTSENTRFIGRTRTAGSVRYDNGRIFTRGPERGFVEQRGNIRIPRTELVDVKERGRAESGRGGNAERIEVYRPRIDASSRVINPARPDRVRVDDHPMGLDPRGTDIRRREDAGQPREPAVRQDYPDRTVNRPAARSDRNVVRPERGVRTPDRPAGTVQSSRPERRMERSYNPPAVRNSPPQRSAAPERRSEPARGERGGGGGRGGRR